VPLPCAGTTSWRACRDILLAARGPGPSSGPPPAWGPPRIPRRRARRRSHAETAAMNSRSTMVVSAGSIAQLRSQAVRRREDPLPDRNAREHAGHEARAEVAHAPPDAVRAKPRRWQLKATARLHPQSRHRARISPCARIPQRRNASTSDTTKAGSAGGSGRLPSRRGRSSTWPAAPCRARSPPADGPLVGAAEVARIPSDGSWGRLDSGGGDPGHGRVLVGSRTRQVADLAGAKMKERPERQPLEKGSALPPRQHGSP
jgi:hypothetical protein